MPVSSLARSDQPYLPFFSDSDFRVPPPRRKRPPRPKLFGTEDACAVVRGILIETLDRAYCDGGLGEVLWRDSGNRELSRVGLDTFQRIQEVLFPEEFAEDRGLAARIAAAKAGREPDSLVPPGGPKRTGAARLKAFAVMLAATRGRTA